MRIQRFGVRAKSTRSVLLGEVRGILPTRNEWRIGEESELLCKACRPIQSRENAPWLNVKKSEPVGVTGSSPVTHTNEFSSFLAIAQLTPYWSPPKWQVPCCDKTRDRFSATLAAEPPTACVDGLIFGHSNGGLICGAYQVVSNCLGLSRKRCTRRPPW